jgi:hypothetical protein
MTIGLPFGAGALSSLNEGFGDLEIRRSGFRREKPTPVVHERSTARQSPEPSVMPIEWPLLGAQNGRSPKCRCPEVPAQRKIACSQVKTGTRLVTGNFVRKIQSIT